MVNQTLNTAERASSLCISQSDGKVPSLVVEASKEIAEFGRDVLLRLLENVGVEVDDEGKRTVQELDIVFQVECPHCERILRLEENCLSDDDPGGYCLVCGEHIENWRDCDDIQALEQLI